MLYAAFEIILSNCESIGFVQRLYLFSVFSSKCRHVFFFYFIMEMCQPTQSKYHQTKVKKKNHQHNNEKRLCEDEDGENRATQTHAISLAAHISL